MTQRFKIGSRVRYVGEGYDSHGEGYDLVNGRLYTVLGYTKYDSLQIHQAQVNGKHGRSCEPFELVSEPLDFTRPLRTKCGKSVTIISMEGRCSQPVLGYIGDDIVLKTWNLDGTYCDAQTPWPFDLENYEEEVEITGYLNIYPEGHAVYNPSKELADNAANKDRIACVAIKTTYKKGQYDE